MAEATQHDVAVLSQMLTRVSAYLRARRPELSDPRRRRDTDRLMSELSQVERDIAHLWPAMNAPAGDRRGALPGPASSDYWIG